MFLIFFLFFLYYFCLEFSWDEVVADKYRECYLGQSLAVNPSWWYDKEHQATGGIVKSGSKLKRKTKMLDLQEIKRNAAEERERLAKEEKDLMAEALLVPLLSIAFCDLLYVSRGLAPQRDRRPRRELKNHELKEIFQRNQEEREDVLENERVYGLGGSA